VTLFKDQIHQLAHTKDGAHAASLLVSLASAKDRKAMVKSVKDVVPQLAKDHYGHNVVIAFCAVVDDTKLVSKSILASLSDMWGDLIRDKWGRTVVLFLCREDNSKIVKECREKSVHTRYDCGNLI
jgi:pumilio homology domain family member 6